LNILYNAEVSHCVSPGEDGTMSSLLNSDKYTSFSCYEAQAQFPRHLISSIIPQWTFKFFNATSNCLL